MKTFFQISLVFLIGILFCLSLPASVSANCRITFLGSSPNTIKVGFDISSCKHKRENKARLCLETKNNVKDICKSSQAIFGLVKGTHTFKNLVPGQRYKIEGHYRKKYGWKKRKTKWKDMKHHKLVVNTPGYLEGKGDKTGVALWTIGKDSIRVGWSLTPEDRLKYNDGFKVKARRWYSPYWFRTSRLLPATVRNWTLDGLKSNKWYLIEVCGMVGHFCQQIGTQKVRTK